MNYSENVNPAIAALLKAAIRNQQTEDIIILEFGCWTGALGKYFLDTYPGLTWYGIERDDGALTVARSRLSSVYSRDIDASELSSIGDLIASSDYIIFADVLEHLINPERLLGQIRSLNPSALIFISLPNIASYEIFSQLSHGDFKYEEHGILDKTHKKFWTPKSFVAWASTLSYAPASDILYLKNNTGTQLYSHYREKIPVEVVMDRAKVLIDSDALLQSVSSYGFALILKPISKCQ